MMITVTSPTFREGGMIPSAHTCDGRDSSPPLEWSGIPAGTKALALVCDDPDAPAGTWVHWVLYNIPADRRSLPGGQPTAETLAGGAGQGVNDFGRFGYGGPCPPSGTHRYYFKLYALDARLDLAGRVTKAALLDAMKGHVLADGALMGRYARRRG
ncbi:MAG: YbhB/YbcL family Raf kinase inhibitor-like protein [Candidatus Aureabacteria bacterium]|nr:YbhB/YbcL family Raf kinase inhibitor-like protein [Candidatus Auribacterota bacterium]